MALRENVGLFVRRIPPGAQWLARPSGFGAPVPSLVLIVITLALSLAMLHLPSPVLQAGSLQACAEGRLLSLGFGNSVQNSESLGFDRCAPFSNSDGL